MGESDCLRLDLFQSEISFSLCVNVPPADSSFLPVDLLCYYREHW